MKILDPFGKIERKIRIDRKKRSWRRIVIIVILRTERRERKRSG